MARFSTSLKTGPSNILGGGGVDLARVGEALDRWLVDDDKVERLASANPLDDAAARVECAQKLVSGSALELWRKVRNNLPHANGGEQLDFCRAGVLVSEAAK